VDLEEWGVPQARRHDDEGNARHHLRHRQHNHFWVEQPKVRRGGPVRTFTRPPREYFTKRPVVVAISYWIARFG
jgi:hypothetical protein